jgi:hypothetical protein
VSVPAQLNTHMVKFDVKMSIDLKL